MPEQLEMSVPENSVKNVVKSAMVLWAAGAYCYVFDKADHCCMV